MLTKELIAELKARLELSKEKLGRQIKDLDKPVDMGDDIDSFDEETDEAEAYSTNLGAVDSLRKRFQKVRDALIKIEEGSYGICEKTGKPIEIELLKADPESRYCMEYKQELQSKE
ncbi:MAG: RNA polymerase-binding protein DksA [Candidatus Harrisonbacteria bacterium CG10_big_fil_rev_8_21_14_0_10_38_8]|uniref:RNA polymerase-binding protein DksA n=1 Tax=Candidatus Harrisonbacteria bacterium CG10_big_fil_rev_8_21_14_0_10_38_8 TaxID=1974582 RepID=A0A2M6WKC3_9BACT|nr:MAG: RNA polymerase-binding protein DksA [Candidatus Harrisonbacteria bacterium CG10_big_fil_rev_8_21_14_0_10_38_8]